ncbi:cutinase family protein [Cellulomonas triticagri]|nr:cutinase family protein [Cellulomonas triticagri]
MRRLFAALALVALVGIGSVGPVAPPATAGELRETCTTYEFIGARGSGQAPTHAPLDPASYLADERAGMGREVFAVFEGVEQAVLAAGESITGHGLRFPAPGVFDGTDLINGLRAANSWGQSGAYGDSVRIGSAELLRRVESRAAQCPDMTFVVAGYSQGAEAAGTGLAALPRRLQQRVAAAAFFGDPLFNANDADPGYSSFDRDHHGAMGARVLWDRSRQGAVTASYCRLADPICNLTTMTVLDPGQVKFSRDLGWLMRTTRSLGIGLFDHHLTYSAADGDLARSPDVRDAVIRLSNALGVTSGVVTSIPTDVVFVIDTTGSMSGPISSVRQQVHHLVRVLEEQSADFRVGLVEFRDWFDAFQARVVTPLTTDTEVFRAGLNGLVAFGGGDTPESVYSGLVRAFDQDWRADVRRTVVLVGDAPPHDPEPVTGLTRDQVVARALGTDVVTGVPGPRAGRGTEPMAGEAPSLRGPVAVYAVNSGRSADTSAAFGDIAEATGGFLIESVGSVADQVGEALLAAGQAPEVQVAPTFSRAGQPASLNAGGTYPAAGDVVVAYDWNLGTGTPVGSYDATTDGPRLEWVFDEPGEYRITVRARTAGGRSAVASNVHEVDPAYTRVPHVPQDVIATTAADAEVEVSWAADPEAYWYTFWDADGEVIDAYSWYEPGWTLYDLPPGEPVTFFLTAGNDLGTSEPAGPFTAVAGGERTPDPAVAPDEPVPTVPTDGLPEGAPGDRADGAGTSAAAVPQSTPGQADRPGGTALAATGAGLVIAAVGALAASGVGARVLHRVRGRGDGD